MKKWDGMKPKTEMEKSGFSSQWPHVTEMKTQNAQHQPQISIPVRPGPNQIRDSTILTF
jgi:hypothetical protein